ncbi:MAG: GH3 auxin-responsive promoter family protein [Bacteroidales bacterium]|nr:GH3 auxin-responsive promoter family protein [Bacteroidales bacterium]
MAILNSVFSWLIKKRIHQIELFKKYPKDVQNEWFSKLILNARDTEWGKKFAYADIKSYKDFRRNVPVSDYEDIYPYIERLRNGEQNLLWNSEIKWFAKSSGTTANKSKFIPVSYESLEECHFKAGKDLISIYYNNFPDAKLFEGMALAMGGTHTPRHINNQLYYDGDLSAILIQNLPFWAEFRRTPQISIALMDEWESKIEMMAHETSVEDVTNISGVPSWSLLLMKRILEISNKKNMSEVWPNMEVFFHGGVNFEPYRAQFEALFPAGGVNFVDTYNASEGFFGIQDIPTQSDMLLMLDYGIFYEFIPQDKLLLGIRDAIPLEEVKMDINYAMVISTNGGLWRYLIGDTVMFTSVCPFRIRITGRTRNFINAFGEELIVDNADKAFATACERCDARINEYHGAPVYFSGNAKGAHEWMIEFEKAPSDLDLFTEIFDNALKNLNSDYEAKRYHSMVLELPKILPLKAGTFYLWLKSRGKLGGQHKVPRLSNNREVIEEIYKIIQ